MAVALVCFAPSAAPSMLPSDTQWAPRTDEHPAPQTYWRDLTAKQKSAAAELGFSPGAWDAGFTPHSFEQTWAELSPAKRRAAESLGYGAQFWNTRVKVREVVTRMTYDERSLGIDDTLTSVIAVAIGSNPRTFQTSAPGSKGRPIRSVGETGRASGWAVPSWRLRAHC